jgi:hypothetical protein
MKKNILFFGMLVCLLTFGLALTGCESPAGSTSGNTPPVITAPETPTNAPGAAFTVAARYDLFGRVIDESNFDPLKTHSFNAVAEFFAAGIDGIGSSSEGGLWRTNFASGPFATDGQANTLPQKAIAADLDGDGYDEVVRALFDGSASTIKLTVARYDIDTQTFSQSNSRTFSY